MNNRLPDFYQVIQNLSKQSSYPAISIIMSTSRTVPERLEDPIRLKDLVKQAEHQLLKKLSPREVEPFLERIEALIADYDFSRSLSGLALFVDAHDAVIVRLPFEVQTHVEVGKGFHKANLLKGLHATLQCWVLELRSNKARLYQAYDGQLDELITPVVDEHGNPKQGFPLDIRAVEERFRTATGVGDRDARYRDDHIKSFFSMVDDELHKVIREHKLPVIVVGTIENISVFKKLTKQSREIIGYQAGDYLNSYELGKAIKPVIAHYHEQQAQQILEQFIEAGGSLKQAFGIHRTWLMAHEGRIDILLVERDFTVFGKVDPDKPDHLLVYEKHTEPDLHNIVDIIIDRVLETRGRVVFFDKDRLKDFEHIGALLRF